MPYESVVSPKAPVIHDGNYLDFVSGDGAVVNGQKRSTGLELRRGRTASPFTQPFDIPLIPQSEWDDRIAEMDRDKSSLDDIMIQSGVNIKDQDGWGYCWVFATTLALEAARAVQGQKYVNLSCSSAGLIIKNYQNRGGWGMEALEYLAEHGVCPASMWPEVPDGARVRESEETKETKLKFRVTEWYELKTFDEVMTCLFLRIPVSTGHNWWGHQILQTKPMRVNNQYSTGIWNSWGSDWGDNGRGVLVRSKAEPDDVAVAPRSIVVIDSHGQTSEVRMAA